MLISKVDIKRYDPIDKCILLCTVIWGVTSSKSYKNLERGDIWKGRYQWRSKVFIDDHKCLREPRGFYDYNVISHLRSSCGKCFLKKKRYYFQLLLGRDARKLKLAQRYLAIEVTIYNVVISLTFLKGPVWLSKYHNFYHFQIVMIVVTVFFLSVCFFLKIPKKKKKCLYHFEKLMILIYIFFLYYSVKIF